MLDTVTCKKNFFDIIPISSGGVAQPFFSFFLPFFLNLGKEKKNRINVQIHHQKSKFHVTITSVHLKLEHSFFKVQDNEKSVVFFFFFNLGKEKKYLINEDIQWLTSQDYGYHIQDEAKKIQFFLPILTQRRKKHINEHIQGCIP